MTNRRQFMQASAALAAASLPAWAALRAGSLPLYKVIYDQRFEAARAFGARARVLGASAQGMRGDVHALWYNDLYHRWRSSPAPIAGMTLYNPMFLLAMMAQDAGLRVIYRAHHRSGSDGAITHEAFGPRALSDPAGQLAAAGDRWPQSAAMLVMSHSPQHLSVAASHSTIAQANARMVGPQTLVSWLIAPVRRV